MEDLLGQMWIEREMPERPKESFLSGLFGGGYRNVDREELCELIIHYFIIIIPNYVYLIVNLPNLVGETAGKSSRSVAKLMPGPAAPPEVVKAQAQANTVAGEVAKTRNMLVERGQKLGQVEDKTEKMMNEAENFSSAAHQLMLKYKDKKWYQL